MLVNINNSLFYNFSNHGKRKPTQCLSEEDITFEKFLNCDPTIWQTPQIEPHTISKILHERMWNAARHAMLVGFLSIIFHVERKPGTFSSFVHYSLAWFHKNLFWKNWTKKSRFRTSKNCIELKFYQIFGGSGFFKTDCSMRKQRIRHKTCLEKWDTSLRKNMPKQSNGENHV